MTYTLTDCLRGLLLRTDADGAAEYLVRDAAGLPAVLMTATPDGTGLRLAAVLPTPARIRAAETVAELDALTATMRRETGAYTFGQLEALDADARERREALLDFEADTASDALTEARQPGARR